MNHNHRAEATVMTTHAMRFLSVVTYALAIVASSPVAFGSVAVYVGKNLTKDGSVLLAGFGDEPSSHWISIVPRRQHPASTMITVGGTSASHLPGELIKIPQVQ